MRSIRLFAILLIAVATASATTIDFNATPVGTYGSLTFGNVTFSAPPGAFQVTPSSPNGTQALVSYWDGAYQIQVDIGGGTNYVAMDMGDYDQDEDTIFIVGFDENWTVLGGTNTYLPADFTGMVNLSFSGSGIYHALLYSTGPFPNSVFFDNFTYGKIPEPGTMLLLGTGLVGAWLRRRAAR